MWEMFTVPTAGGTTGLFLSIIYLTYLLLFVYYMYDILYNSILCY